MNQRDRIRMHICLEYTQDTWYWNKSISEPLKGEGIEILDYLREGRLIIIITLKPNGQEDNKPKKVNSSKA